MRNYLIVLVLIGASINASAQVDPSPAQIADTCRTLEILIKNPQPIAGKSYVPILYLTYKYLNEKYSIPNGTKKVMSEVNNKHYREIERIEKQLSSINEGQQSQASQYRSRGPIYSEDTKD